ncbi:MAG: hypothetical protein D6696_21180 [Acidobacteria bacterium]|nr:MAG: hypothetical protein D6696_21180 [Acidobacteriota bacterium]
MISSGKIAEDGVSTIAPAGWHQALRAAAALLAIPPESAAVLAGFAHGLAEDAVDVGHVFPLSVVERAGPPPLMDAITDSGR